MIQLSIEEKPAFSVCGRKTWISRVEDFHVFWDQLNQDGTIDVLKGLGGGPGPVTQSDILGVSRVEDDPDKRDFWFYIASECGARDERFETFCVPAARWAIFRAEGEMMDALFEEEMYAFQTWLPSSGCRHAAAPELEVYPAKGEFKVEFWLPIE